MKRLVLAMTLSTAFLLSGCKGCSWFKPSCDLTKKYSSNAAIGMAAFLDCKNPDAIEKDLNGVVDKLNLCENTPTGPIADVICEPVAVAISQLAVQGLPSSWECSGGAAAKAVKQALYTACKLIPY